MSYTLHTKHTAKKVVHSISDSTSATVEVRVFKDGVIIEDVLQSKTVALFLEEVDLVISALQMAKVEIVKLRGES
jgi:hypothetical protein